MTENKPITISQFFKDHLWQIIVAVGAATIAFVWLKADVINLARRLNIVEARQETYPSQEWFELKFQTIDDKFVVLEKKIDNQLLTQ